MGLFLVHALLALAAIYIVKRLFLTKSIPAPLPPGPPPKPIVGNLGDLPPADAYPWKHWLKHKELYGPISSVSVFGQRIVILNEARIAFDLLKNRSAIYSSRPKQVFISELVGWEHSLTMQPYSDRFKSYRKAIHNVMGSDVVVSKFDSLQDVETRRFLLRMLRDPAGLVQHLRAEAGAIILKIAYGYTIDPHKPDVLVNLADQAVEEFSNAAAPGKWLVDIVPMLKYIPTWFPGAQFKRIAQASKAKVVATAEQPYNFVRRQMKLGTHKPSYVSSLIEEKPPGSHSKEEEWVIKWSAMSLYTGGADTTVASLTCFYLAMGLFPDVQRKAREEIDSMIGHVRLPTVADREKLPYIDALVKETLRWNPVAPMAVPHTSTQDDIYEGYFIPKGSMLLPNIQAYTQDPNVYHDPTVFKPERFLGPNPELDPYTMAFGFGRRICPAKLLADKTLFLTIAKSLAVFNIDKTAEGLQPIFLPGVISYPAPFKLNVTPRSPEHEALIRSVQIDHPWEEGDAAALESLK